MDEHEPKSEHLQMEYEQTIQTLRNWDTLFFNTFASIVIAGFIGGVMAWEKTTNILQLKAILIVVPSTLYLVCVLYFLYNRLIARRKFEVLGTIEQKLHLVGAYKAHNTQIKKILNWFFLPFFTGIYMIYVILVIVLF